MVGLLTTARGWHGAFTPAHGISQNRPKQSGLTIDILFYERAHLIMKASLHTKRQLEIDRDRGAAVGSLAQQYRLQL